MNVHLFAGYADKNATLFRRLQVPLGDPAAWIEINGVSTALVRDLEMGRVRERSQATTVTCPAEHSPRTGLDADRETATAQAVAEFLSQQSVRVATVDRTFPYIFASHLKTAGIELVYDHDLGVIDRRVKNETELAALAAAQSTTEEVMRLLCERVAKASVNDSGELLHDGVVMTSESVRAMAAIEFLKRNFTMGHGAIVATAPHVADCHHAGAGALKTGVPVIVDLFPRDESTRYWGDCTRTTINGKPSETVTRMHAAVVAAKAACEALLIPGNTADAAHKASEETLIAHGFETSRGAVTDHASIQHGTGHGIGLDVHEPILLDHGGGEMLENEVFTVEPGLYGRDVGGVRIEDMLVVTRDGARNLNQLPDGLDWLA